jgi:protein-disulfide isomerase
MLLPARRLVQILVAVLVASCAHAPDAAPTAPVQGAEAAKAEEAAKAGDPKPDFNVIGSFDVRVVVIEFTDLQCPYCAHFANHVFPRLKAAYVDTGKIRYVSRDLPLPMHAHAVTAAVAARCAGEQDRYWEYRHAVFADQQRIGAEPWDDFAKAMGLDLGRFDACRRDGRQLKAVRADAQFALYQGLSSTPSFALGRLVNGEFVLAEKFSGAKTYEAFAARIDALLAN